MMNVYRYFLMKTSDTINNKMRANQIKITVSYLNSKIVK